MKTTNRKPKKIEQLVVNWHVTEACNYFCRYCYSSWVNESKKGEILQDPVTTSQILKELHCFFNPSNAINPLRKNLRWKSVRLSLAGGEALLYPGRTMRVAQEANSLGFKVSLITNGSLLCHKDLSGLMSNLSMLGISIDSSNPQTNHLIGRINTAKQELDLHHLAEEIQRARVINPELIVKVNTVVNKLNADENMGEVINLLSPDKWKVLRVLPIANADLTVTDHHFRSFVERHGQFRDILSAEDNQDMTESYLMVDPYGRFFQNQPSTTGVTSYIYSQPILQDGAEAAFNQINFDIAKFTRRYPVRSQGEVA